MDKKHLAFAASCGLVAFVLGIVATSIPRMYNIDTGSETVYMGVFNGKGDMDIMGTDYESGTERIHCSDYHDMDVTSNNADGCEQECYTMQAFSIIGIVGCFICTTLLMMFTSEQSRLVAISCGIIASVSYIIVWGIATRQYTREDASKAACSHSQDTKLGASYILFVIASGCTLLQTGFAFMTRDVQLFSIS